MRRRSRKKKHKSSNLSNIENKPELLLPNLGHLAEKENSFLMFLYAIFKTYYPSDCQRILKECGIGIACGASLALKSAMVVAFRESFYNTDNNEKRTEFDYNYNFWTLYVLLLGPMLEELLFRGVIPAVANFTLKSYLNPTRAQNTAIYGSNILFALGHPPNKLSSFINGFFYQKLQIKTEGSLLANTTAHMTHNALAVSGQIHHAANFIKKLF